MLDASWFCIPSWQSWIPPTHLTESTQMAKTSASSAPTLRQGDVLLVPVLALPAGCTEVPDDHGRIVLAYGEVTGHAHAIADHHFSEADAAKQASEVIGRAQAKAKLLTSPSGQRYLHVIETVTIRHEEHSAHKIPPGIYKLPTQVEYTPAELRRVED